MKPIAVITNNIPATFEWLKDTYQVDEINIARRTAVNTKTNQKYVLILEKEQAYSWEFSDYLISPSYYSLEQVVRSRVR